MTRIISCLLVLAVSFQIYGQSKLTRSCKKIKESIVINDKKTADAYLKVDLVSNNKAEIFSIVSTEVPKTIFDLKEKGQEALIESLNQKTNSPEDLISSLRSELSSSSSSSESANVKRTTYLKTIEIDVKDILRGTDRLGRIDELLFRIKLPDNNIIKFKSLNNIATKYEYINFGKIGLTRNQSFTFNAGLEFAGTGSTASTEGKTETKKVVIGGDTVDITDVSGGSNSTGTSNKSNLGVTYTAGRTITEEAEVKRRRIAMKGSIGSHEIMIYQEGAPQLNLNDKITLEIVFEVTNVGTYLVLDLDNLFDENGKPVIDSSMHKLTPYYLTIVDDNIVDSIVDVKLEYEFVYREIINQKGKRSPGEWDDKIEYIKLVDPTMVSSYHTLINKRELKYDQWYVQDTATKQILSLDYHGAITQLKFFSLADVTEFLKWLKESQLVEFRDFQLMLSEPLPDRVLTKDDIKNLELFIVL